MLATHSKSNLFTATLGCLLTLLALAVAIPAGGQVSDPASERSIRLAMRTKASAEALAKLDDRQKLAIGDQVSFKIAEDREELKRLVVSDTGEVEIPYIGRHKVTEKTCVQAALEIKGRLEKEFYYCATPVLSVETLTKTRGKVLVSGMVLKADSVDIPVDEGLTVTKAIFKAGGFQEPFANKKEVSLTRKLPDGSKTNMIINVQEILEKGKSEKDIPLQPDDMIYVRRKIFNGF